MSKYDSIQRDAAGERQKLAASLDSLSRAISPENIQSQAAVVAEAYGGDIGRQAWGAARQNPAAFALVGAGLGLLFTGTGSRPEALPPKATLVPADEAYTGFDARVAAAEEKLNERATGMMEPEATPRAAWLRAKLNDGLDSLSPEARARVIEARKSVLEVQEKVEEKARIAARKSQTFMHDQPLAVGALAVGMGALIGALLPSTRREDDLLGEHRDAAMAQARRTLQEELEKVSTAAQSSLRQASNSGN